MPSFRSALECEHANETPGTCPCPSNCYCKANACRNPARLALHPPQRAEPPKTEADASNILGQFPHCDPRVLHKPGDCEYCDAHPDWQAIRILYGINFTGENDPQKSECPAVARRAAATIHQWGGNRPTNATVAVEIRSRYDRELNETSDNAESADYDNLQRPETD